VFYDLIMVLRQYTIDARLVIRLYPNDG